jgi:hypothetical protein
VAADNQELICLFASYNGVESNTKLTARVHHNREEEQHMDALKSIEKESELHVEGGRFLHLGKNRSNDPTDDFSSDDCDDDSVDDNADLKQIRPSNGFGSSIRRSDSWVSFLTRSERNVLLGKDQPPPPSEASKRKVQFRDSDALEAVREVEIVDDKDKDKLYMNNTDFDRIETDVKLTRFRWDNHVMGKIPFDESQNSMRGLEHLNHEQQRKKDLARYHHKQRVFHEVNQQKAALGRIEDWEKIRQASELLSTPSKQHARDVGRIDAQDSIRAWNSNGDAAACSTSTPTTKGEEKTKKKSLFGGMFGGGGGKGKKK